MDIKDLNKSQLILLTILISFITSIATGIATVSLLQEAPISIPTPINRVVQQTVEKIQQVEGKTTVQTVVVKEEDLVVEAISKNQGAAFTLSRSDLDINSNPIKVTLGRAFAVSPNNIVVTDAKLTTVPNEYFVKNASGEFRASIISTSGNLTFLKIGDPISAENKLAFSLPSLGDIKDMKAGQKLIIFGNSIVTDLYDGDSTLSIPISKSNGGSMVMNLDGSVIGMSVSGDVGSFVPMSTISQALAVIDTAPGTSSNP